MPQRRRILISSFALSPVRGSEAAVGWQLCTGIAKHHDITVLCTPGTIESSRDQIDKWIAQHGPVPGMTIQYVEPTLLLRFVDHGSGDPRRLLFYFGYASWQRAALRIARKLHAEKPFDAVHHITIVGYREPGYLWKLPIPFFWGPIAGASNMPWKYFPVLSFKDRAVYAVRNLLNEFQKRFSLRCRRAARAAVQIWALAPDAVNMVQNIWHCPCTHMFETGTAPRAEASVKNYDGTGPLKLVFSGYHVGRKALSLALHALTKLDANTPVELSVLGDGPERARWKSLATKLNLDGNLPQRVIWLDQLPHADAIARMSAAHAMIFPSLQEATSTVVPEALSLGLPVICHDICGMGVLATQDCAIKIPPSGPAQSITAFASAIHRLAHEPGLVQRLSQGALARSEQVSWSHKVEEIVAAYDRALAK